MMSTSKHQVEAYFLGNPRSIAAKILFIKRSARLEEYKQHLIQAQEFGNVWHGVTGLIRGEKITIIVTGIGPSMIGDAVYALNRPGSVCLYSGTCGGLRADLEIGDYFIADHAICGDGYSFHFRHSPLSEVAGDFRALESLKSVIASRVKRMDCGTAFTTSSMAREADSDFWGVVSDKCQIIEMAATAFYAAASATDKKAAAYFWVTDLPTRGKSFFDVLTPEEIRTKQDRYDRAVTLDLELLSSL
jgi:purine-nucleoside phosphorylase